MTAHSISKTDAGEHALSDQEIDFISRFIYDRSGILLGQSKRYLIETRLRTVARTMGLDSVSQVCRELSNNTPQLETLVLDALTTNETSWFRDGRPFEALENIILPAIARSKQIQALQIWSAACSTGQEPYGIAMKVIESGLFRDWTVRIVASDIAAKALEQAREGIYSQLEVSRGLPVKMLVKYFKQIGDVWKISPDVAQYVSFREHVLQKDAGALGTFDLIFCRNVLIYFDRETKTKILDNLYRVLTAEGLLALGGSETTFGLDNRFRSIKIGNAVFYCKHETSRMWDELAD